jgi:hypothetical protein
MFDPQVLTDNALEHHFINRYVHKNMFDSQVLTDNALEHHFINRYVHKNMFDPQVLTDNALELPCTKVLSKRGKKTSRAWGGETCASTGLTFIVAVGQCVVASRGSTPPLQQRRSLTGQAGVEPTQH